MQDENQHAIAEESSERAGRLRHFANFVSEHLAVLLQSPGDTLSRAVNWAEGPVAERAEQQIRERRRPCLQRSPRPPAAPVRPQCLRTLEGHRSWVKSVSMSPDGRRAVSGSEDKTVRVWDLETGQCLAVYHAGSAVGAVTFSPAGSRIICETDDGQMHFLTPVNLPTHEMGQQNGDNASAALNAQSGTVFGSESRFAIKFNSPVGIKCPEQKKSGKEDKEPDRKRVLIIDDDSLQIEVTRRILEKGLKKFTVTVDSAENEADGMELFKRGHPGVIVLDDSIIPAEKIFENMAAFCEVNGWRMPCVVFVSSQNRDLTPYLNSGDHFILFTPFSMNKILNIVAPVVSGVKPW